MINFILCENEKMFREKLRNQIDNFMMNSDLDYKVYEFDCCEKDFRDIVAADIGFKVYFLDIKMKGCSGIDAARYIRETREDWCSLIAIVTAFNEYRYAALGNRLFLLDFISKYDNCETRIMEALGIVLKNYGERKQGLRYEYNHTAYFLEYKNIIYIEKEQDSKRCIVYTTYGQYKVPMTLTDLRKKLNNYFLQVHRSLIVNLDRIHSFNVVQNTITFDNGETTNLVARGKRKELMESVAAINR